MKQASDQQQDPAPSTRRMGTAAADRAARGNSCGDDRGLVGGDELLRVRASADALLAEPFLAGDGGLEGRARADGRAWARPREDRNIRRRSTGGHAPAE